MDDLKNIVWECAVWNDWSVQETGDLFYDFIARGQIERGGENCEWRLKIASDWLEFRARAIVLPPSQSLDLLRGPMEGLEPRKSLRQRFKRGEDAPQSRLTVYYLPTEDENEIENSQVCVGELILHDDNLTRAGWHLLTFDLDPYEAHRIFDRDCEDFLRLHLAREASEEAELETEMTLNEDGLRLFLRAPVKSAGDLKLAVAWGLKIAKNVGT